MSWSPPKEHKSRPITVLGGGVLGRRIAACFVSAGWHVIIRDPSSKSSEDALQYIRDNLADYLALSHLEAGTYEAIEDFETAPLEQHARSDCILASNSSSFMSRELLGKVKDETKTRVLNTHFMMPPQALIVELMTSGSTAGDIFPFLSQEMVKCGLKPVTAKRESSGFIFNRIWAAIKREVLMVIAEGVADPQTIDRVWMDMYQSPAGPCLDTVEHIETNYVQKRHLPTTTLKWLHDNYVGQGKLGNKSNNGGLYPAPPPGEKTKLLVLNMYQGAAPDELSLQSRLSSGQILEFAIENKSARPKALVTGQITPDGIEVHGDRMYWTSMGVPSRNDGAVYSACLDGSDIQTVIPSGEIHTPKQLHIDQDSGKIYVADREGLRVHRCNLDGSQHEVIIQAGDYTKEPEKVKDQTNWPVGIAVSRKLGKIFWTQKGPSKSMQGRIFSAGIDSPAGSDASSRQDIQVIAENLPEPIDLELDDESGVLYWTDRGEIPTGNTLNKKTIVGGAPAAEGQLGREIIAQGFGEAIGLRLDKERDCIYVSDLSGRLWKCMTVPGPKEKLYESAGHAYTGLAMVRH
ncbi:3-hydroxyacyl-CoA dehydrogenase, NAD binding domain-containing protein [Sarocladium implicatum]|nr:3-hydroxyacyl-CoA dehydrogenase, NAD binding domain-containing protein [Sarocladium implicatum]